MKIKFIIKLKFILCLLNHHGEAQSNEIGRDWGKEIETIRVVSHEQIINWAKKVDKMMIVYTQVPCIPPLKPDQAKRISSAFGWRIHPISGKLHFHSAIDISGISQKIHATASGVIRKIGYNKQLGWHIWIDHQNSYKTLYAHLQYIQVVQGQSVVIGEEIGGLGCSGQTTGYHLHYGIQKNGYFVNPLPMITLLNDGY